MSENTAELIDDLHGLVVATAPAARESIDVANGDTIDEVQFRLTRYFRAEGAPSAVNLMVGAIHVGVVTRESLRHYSATAAEPYEIGVGERMALAGASTRYKLLTFTCPHCPDLAYRVYYDERYIPACAHGRMELRS